MNILIKMKIDMYFSKPRHVAYQNNRIEILNKNLKTVYSIFLK